MRRRTDPARIALLTSAALCAGLLPLGTAGASAAAPGEERRASVGPAAAVVAVDEGRTAHVPVTVTTSDGGPLTTPVRVNYRTASGGEGASATPGRDVTAVSGTLTFPAGTASGASRTVSVATKADGRAETAESVTVELAATGARSTAERATVVVNAHGLPYLDRRLPVKQRVEDLVSRMTLAEKAGQMTQAERGALASPQDITSYALGSLLSGGGSVPTPNTPEGWVKMLDGFQARALATRLQVPLIYGVDAVHGHNNLLGATVLPHNVGLGAARDPGLTRRTGEVTAKETRATGVPWTFAPCLCVTRDDRWGRAYESFGEDPALVKAMTSIVRGLQGRADGSQLDRNDKVLATGKHFVGDGGTAYGSSTTGKYTIDQGVTTVTRRQLQAVHLDPYAAAVDRGVGSVMPSFSSLDIVGDGAGPVKMHADAAMINGVLKGRMGFTGFTVSDWQAIDQIPGDYPSDVRTSVNAGLDMIMVPYAYQDFLKTLTAEVEAGRIPLRRIDDAVSRILTQKFRLGLFEKPYADTAHIGEIGSAAHRAVAREAAARSQVLLKNEGDVLPLARDAKVYVAGSNADDLGNQAGGWTVTWQGASGPITRGTTVLEGMRQLAPGSRITYSKDASAPTAGHDTGVVVVGETPYAEGEGDVGNGHDLELSAADKAAVDTVCSAMKCAVLVVSGRPQLIGDRLPAIDALVASWLPGTEGAGVADVLYGERPFTGRLPVTWPRSESQLPINIGDSSYDPQFPYGWGLTTQERARGELATAARADRALGAALRVRDWSDRAGAGRALAHLATAARHLERTDGGRAQREAVAGAARWIAQDAVGQHLTARTSALLADADHRLLTGDVTGAVEKLTAAHRAR